MQCEKCSAKINEGNFVSVPAHKATPSGIVACKMIVICCDNCATGISNKIGSAKIVDAEIVD